MMTLPAFRLLQKHQRIDSELRLEMAHRIPDFARVLELKKRKLAAKDALAALLIGRTAAPTR